MTTSFKLPRSKSDSVFRGGTGKAQSVQQEGSAASGIPQDGQRVPVRKISTNKTRTYKILGLWF